MLSACQTLTFLKQQNRQISATTMKQKQDAFLKYLNGTFDDEIDPLESTTFATSVPPQLVAHEKETEMAPPKELDLV